MTYLLFCATLAHAGELDQLLARGELSLTEITEDGRLRQVTTISDLPYPPEQVWDLMVDFGAWHTWMPQIEASNVVASDAQTIDILWSIQIPGPNLSFQARYTLDRDAWTVTGNQTGGMLEGSHWSWRLEPRGGGTRVWRSAYINVVGDNWLIRQFDNDSHTLEFGINAATGVIEVRGLQDALKARSGAE